MKAYKWEDIVAAAPELAPLRERSNQARREVSRACAAADAAAAAWRDADPHWLWGYRTARFVLSKTIRPEAVRAEMRVVWGAHATAFEDDVEAALSDPKIRAAIERVRDTEVELTAAYAAQRAAEEAAREAARDVVKKLEQAESCVITY